MKRIMIMAIILMLVAGCSCCKSGCGKTPKTLYVKFINGDIDTLYNVWKITFPLNYTDSDKFAYVYSVDGNEMRRYVYTSIITYWYDGGTNGN